MSNTSHSIANVPSQPPSFWQTISVSKKIDAVLIVASVALLAIGLLVSSGIFKSIGAVNVSYFSYAFYASSSFLFCVEAVRVLCIFCKKNPPHLNCLKEKLGKRDQKIAAAKMTLSPNQILKLKDLAKHKMLFADRMSEYYMHYPDLESSHPKGVAGILVDGVNDLIDSPEFQKDPVGQAKIYAEMGKTMAYPHRNIYDFFNHYEEAEKAVNEPVPF